MKVQYVKGKVVLTLNEYQAQELERALERSPAEVGHAVFNQLSDGLRAFGIDRLVDGEDMSHG